MPEPDENPEPAEEASLSEEVQTNPDDEENSPLNEEAESTETEETVASDAEEMEGSDTEDGDQASEEDAGPAEAKDGEEEKKEKKIAHEITEIEDLPDSVKRFKFQVPWAEYDNKTGDIFKDLLENANIEGFRRGKAPMPLVRVRFGRQVEKEALQSIMDNCLEQVIEEKELTIYNRFDDQLPEIEREKPLDFATSFEVKPEIDPTGYDELEIEIQEIILDDEMLQKELEQIQRANGKWEARGDDDPVEAEDSLMVDTKVTDGEGQPLPELTWENRSLPSLKHLPPEISEAVVGKKKDDEVEVAIPEKKSEEGELEQPASNWTLKILEVKRMQLPQIDDEFARDVGDFKDLESLKERIRTDLEKQKAAGERSQTLEKIHKLLLKRNEFAIPKMLSTITQSDMMRRDIDRLERSGLSLEDIGQTKEEYQAQMKDNADKFLKINLLLEAIAAKESIEVNDEEVDAALKRLAEQSGRKPLAVRAQLEAQKRWDGFHDDLRLEKVADFLIARGKVHKIAPPPVEAEEG